MVRPKSHYHQRLEPWPLDCLPIPIQGLSTRQSRSQPLLGTPILQNVASQEIRGTACKRNCDLSSPHNYLTQSTLTRNDRIEPNY